MSIKIAVLSIGSHTNAMAVGAFVRLFTQIWHESVVDLFVHTEASKEHHPANNILQTLIIGELRRLKAKDVASCFPSPQIVPHSPKASKFVHDNYHYVIDADGLCEGLVNKFDLVGMGQKGEIVSILSGRVLDHINAIDPTNPPELGNKKDIKRPNQWVNDVDLGLNSDVSMLNDVVKETLVELFSDKPDTTWNRWLAQCMVRGICASLPELAFMHEKRNK